MRVTSVMDISDTSQSRSVAPGPAERHLPFYLQAVGAFDAGRHYMTEREGFASHLLLYTLQGCGQVEQGKEQRLLPVNHAVLIDCREPHRYATWLGDDSTSSWKFCYIHFDGNGIAPYLERINSGRLQILHLSDEGRGHLLDQLAMLFDWTSPQGCITPQRDLHTAVLLHEMLTNLTCEAALVTGAGRLVLSDPALDQIQSWMSQHYTEPLTLAEIARKANLSPYHFSRLFRHYTGQAPCEWLMRYRISQAKNLLRNSKTRVHDIAAACGFNHPNHFSRMFKRHTGMTPQQYRRDRWLI